MNPMGGSEILYLNMLKHVGTDWQDRVNLILSSCDHAKIDPNKINVVWQHLNTNEEQVALMADPAFVERVDYFVFVSHWQYNKFRQVFNVPAYKSIVIKNAIEPIQFMPRREGKTKLIYTSTPWRGLDILLDAFELLDRTDIELDVYSSSKIYGDHFEKITQGRFDELFERTKNTLGVNFHEYQPNHVVRAALQQAHIFAYPSIFEETSCLAAIEAAAAGCLQVTTSHGALPETCSDWAYMVPVGMNHRQVLASRFARELDLAMAEYWKVSTQYHIHRQSTHYNHYWSWEQRKLEWQQFFSTIRAYG